MPCLHSPCRGSWRGRKSWREMPAVPMYLRGESPLLINFEGTPPQHILLVLGYLEDCSSGGWKVRIKRTSDTIHHLCLSIMWTFPFPYSTRSPPGSCPRHNGKKETCGGTLQLDKQHGLWRHQASIQADLQPPDETLSCRQRAGESATHIPRGISLCSPEQHHSHHFTVTHLWGNPQGSCPILQTKYDCWCLHFSALCPLIFYCPSLLESMCFNYSVKSYRETNAKLCPNPCGSLVYQVRTASVCGVEPPLLPSLV